MEMLLRFPATGGQTATIGGFSSGSVRVIDVTNPGAVVDLNGTVSKDGSTYSVTAVVPGTGARKLMAFAARSAEDSSGNGSG